MQANSRQSQMRGLTSKN